MLFDTERLLVRQFTAADTTSFYTLSSDVAVMQYIRATLTMEACTNLIQEQVNAYKKNPYFGRFAVIEKCTQQYVGNFLLRPSSFMGGTETGYAFLPQAWGRGYATEITRAALRFGFGQLQLQMIYAVTAMQHAASQKVLLKCGFIRRRSFTENGKELYLFDIKSPLQEDMEATFTDCPASPE